jgi:hypothetical protein
LGQYFPFFFPFPASWPGVSYWTAVEDGSMAKVHEDPVVGTYFSLTPPAAAFPSSVDPAMVPVWVRAQKQD